MRVLALLLVLVLDAVAALFPVAGQGPATWSDVNGTTGLTVKYVDCDSTTGSPPSVSIMGGVLGYTLSDWGGGQYGRWVPEGCYYVFVGGVYKQAAAVYAAVPTTKNGYQDSTNWVTNPRMADNSVGWAEVINGSLTGADIQDASLSNAEIAAGVLYYYHLHNSLKGSGVDTTFSIEEIQDSLRALYGAWSSGDYSVDVLSDKVKTLEGTAFSAATVTQVVSGYPNGVRSYVTLNSAENYDAVRVLEWFIGDVPYLHAAGAMDSTSYANLAAGMMRYASISSPGRRQQAQFISATDTTYVVAVATDFAGNHVSSGWSVGYPGNIDVGQSSSLVGMPYYSEGNDIVDVLRTILPKLQNLETKDATLNSQDFVDHVFQKRRVTTDGSASINGGIILDTIDVVGPPFTAGVFDFVKTSNVTQADIYFNARAAAVGDSGRVYLEIGSAGTLHFAIPYSANYVGYHGSLSIGGLPDDSCYVGYVRGYVNDSSDKIYLRECVVVLR